jgi:hypothetical protein
MAQRGPLVTAVVAVGGIVGLMTANAAGGLVTAGGPSPSPTQVGATQTDQPPAAGAQAPVETTTAPPVETTTVPETTTEEEPPPAAQFPAEVVFVGEAADVPLWIAVAVKGDEASAYICDGKTVEVWLKGTAENGEVELASKDGAATLEGALEGEALSGTVTVAGQPHEFAINVGPPPAGLYRGENGDTSVGWIVMPNGKVIGVAKTPSGNKPAPALDPARGGVTFQGEFLPAEQVVGTTTFG